MKQVIAMHGWSGDSHSWRPWIDHFEQHNWYWQSAERGYGQRKVHEPDWQVDPAPLEQQRRVVIAHSLGPHLLADEVFMEATDVVLLASFSRFVPQGPKGRALVTALEGMRRCLGQEAETQMLNHFLARAAAPSPPTAIPQGPMDEGLSPEGRERLTDDLNRLMTCAELPSGLHPRTRVLVVEAGQDAIVVPAAREELLKALHLRLRNPVDHWLIHGSGHALLVPDLLNQVRRWLDQEQTLSGSERSTRSI